MTDAAGQQISLDADVLEGTSDGLQITYQTSDGQTVTTIASDNADIVSKAFTTMAEGGEQNVEYITMTPEEAAAAGVVTSAEDEQVVTTSLQFDPANPSVLYTADGTPINQADLTPEEQALVQAALQQHLAEQEAEQQIALMQQSESGEAQATVADAGQAVEGAIVTSTSLNDQQIAATQGATVMGQANAMVSSTGATLTQMPEGVDLASPATSASQIVQSLANNVRKQQLKEQMQQVEDTVQKPIVVPKSTKPDDGGISTTGGMKYEEKIVIRQGQPQVVKVPIRKKPEIPAALANLMPKVEIGKDGSQVIRIHQSQITQSQLKALQENPNVRLVFRPASSSRAAPGKVPPMKPKKRGRPPKSQTASVDPSAKITSDGANEEDEEPHIEDPPAKTRCGRLSKRPVYTRDYLTPKLAQGIEDADEDAIVDPGDDNFTPKSTSPQSPKRPRGRPPGSRAYKRTSSYASKIEALRNQDNESTVAVPTKPTLTPIEQAISTRRKNRLREMLSACSEDEIMEVAMPHLARVFSLWEFLITKVEKNKMTRVFFADVYKEYECLHKYVFKLAEKYKEAIEGEKMVTESVETTTETAKENGEKKDEKEEEKEEKKAEEVKEKAGKEETETKHKMIIVTCKKLAESLGLDETTLMDAEIPLLDPEEAIGPRLMGKSTTGVRRGVQPHKYMEDKIIRKQKAFTATATSGTKVDSEKEKGEGATKPIQTEATSTILQVPLHSPTKATVMPPLKPLGQSVKVTKSGTEAQSSATATDASATNVNGSTDGKTEEKNTAESTTEGTTTTTSTEEPMQTDTGTTGTTGGTQLIQIGQGDDQQFIEVPEGYTLIDTPEGLVMSQPGTTISQGEDGTIYVTHPDGTTTPLNATQQQGVPMETVESLLSLDGQQQQQA